MHYNVTLWHGRVTTVAVEKQWVLHSLSFIITKNSHKGILQLQILHLQILQLQILQLQILQLQILQLQILQPQILQLQITVNEMQRFLNLLIFTDALHVSSGSSAHHQEHITVHTVSGIVKPILLLAAIVDEMELT